MTPAAPLRRIGVVGAGTMGAGIAQVSACSGADTLLYDPVAGAAGGGAQRIRESLARGVARGRLSDEAARTALERLRTTDRLSDVHDRQLVIEAAPEDLELKRAAFEALDGGCAPDAVLATNTSSIPVTAIAAAARRPERVVGLHFFNPVPAMRLVEVIPAAQTSEATLAATIAASVQLGKQPIIATDSPGFLVNRCGRPFYTEALRIVAEQIATPAQVDRICRLGGGFRMGPFELMDMVGIDVGLAVMQSFAEGSFGEPRWRPSPLQARLVAAGHLGRKSGRGWYVYDDGPHRDPDPEPPVPDGGRLALRVHGDGPVAARVRALAAAAGVSPTDDPAAPVLLADEAAGAPVNGDAVRLRSCAASSLVGHGDPSAVGFCLSPDPGAGRMVELGATRISGADALDEAQRIFEALGLHVERVADGPGLVLQRIRAQIVNEACFTAGEGIGSAADIDAGVTLGLNHPCGPMELGARLGFGVVLGTLDALWSERREERYRPAPLLSEAALTGVVERVEVETDVVDGVLVITIARPQRRNAVDRGVAEGIAAAVDRLDAEADLRVGILTGAGGYFCAGMDLKAFAGGERPHVPGRGFGGLVQRPPTTPLIAAVEGFALAGGMELALACDVIVAARDARFGLPEVRRGLVPAAGGLLRLPALISRGAAVELVLTGDAFSAERAFELGLVTRLTDPGRALEVALELAGAIAQGAPLATAAATRILRESASWPPAEAWTRQAALADPVIGSQDAKEGARAFAEKRAPRWEGR